MTSRLRLCKSKSTEKLFGWLRFFRIFKRRFYRPFLGIGSGGSENFLNGGYHGRIRRGDICSLSRVSFKVIELERLTRLQLQPFPVPHSECLLKSFLVKLPVKKLVVIGLLSPKKGR